MTEERRHPGVATLEQQFVEGKIDRREFLRLATLLGLSAGSAYAFIGRVTGDTFVASARAAMPKGGTLRIGTRVKEIKTPHTYSWGQLDSNVFRQVCEYLTRTGADNITRPGLVERWEAGDDLKTWTLHLRRDVKWHKGRAFVADDVVWNLKRVLDPATGSSTLGLMKGYMMNDDGTALWDANAIEKVDDHTVRLNARTPQIAVPEHLFHYALPISDPEENGVFGVGSNGTGAFELIDFAVGEKAVLKARSGFWLEGPYVDQLELVDLGDDPATAIGALAAKQVNGLALADPVQYDALKAMEHLEFYRVSTAETAVMRVKVTQAPFTDPRVRKAMRLAIDPEPITQAALRGLGVAGEHHHVSAIHPEYAKLPAMTRNVEEAKRLLAEAGFPNGIDTEMAVPKDPAWQPLMVQTAVEQWKEAGIRVKINLMPGQQFWEVWDKVPFACTTWYHRPLGIMVLGLAYRTGVPWNESEYANPEFDGLLTQAEGMLDVDKRRGVLATLETIMQEDGPIVQPLWRSNFTFFEKRVKGFEAHPTGYIFGHQLAIEA